VDHANNVVQCSLIHRKAGIALLGSFLQELLECDVLGHAYNLGTRHHHLLGGLIAKVKDTPQEYLLLIIQETSISNSFISSMEGGNRASTHLPFPFPGHSISHRYELTL